MSEQDTSSRKVICENPKAGDEIELFKKLFKRIESNFASGERPLSPNIARSNWRWEEQPNINKDNRSKEKQLEKRIATLPGWTNQMPAASDYAGPNKNRKNSIDLVRQVERESEYDFIELKLTPGSGYPIYAAFEILSYGFLYLLTRTDKTLQERFQEKPDKPVLKATKINLVVLAPKDAYYQSDPKTSISDLQSFERSIKDALGKFATEKIPTLTMTFAYRFFTDEVIDKIDTFTVFQPHPIGGTLDQIG